MVETQKTTPKNKIEGYLESFSVAQSPRGQKYIKINVILEEDPQKIYSVFIFFDSDKSNELLDSEKDKVLSALLKVTKKVLELAKDTAPKNDQPFNSGAKYLMSNISLMLDGNTDYLHLAICPFSYRGEMVYALMNNSSKEIIFKSRDGKEALRLSFPVSRWLDVKKAINEILYKVEELKNSPTLDYYFGLLLKKD
ncbi:MAG: hypothetical protein ACP5RT_01610 [Candidatus Micrarchaeia archaeon]